ncbi:MAG TPA: hypothetical protein VH062_01310 [Polyangiaceae bacterium]|jgi:hypothetical protein|nr:hypothetical protein [Polyangiaceae bacterium]
MTNLLGVLRGIALVTCSSLLGAGCSSDSSPGNADGGNAGAASGGSSGSSAGSSGKAGSSGSAGSSGKAGSGGAAAGGSSGASSGGRAGATAGGAAGAAQGGNAGASAGGASGAQGSGGTTDRDAMTEPTDAQADAGSDPCSSCKAGELCVEHIVEGGALFLADAGRCANGRVPVPSGGRTICETAPSYTCDKLPVGCNGASHCGCARSLCNSANLCKDVSPTLMQCTLQAP